MAELRLRDGQTFRCHLAIEKSETYDRDTIRDEVTCAIRDHERGLAESGIQSCWPDSV
jgi:hypothetical protein